MHEDRAPAIAPPDRQAVLLLDRADAQLVDTWLRGLSRSSIAAYKRIAYDFLGAIRKPLRFVTLHDARAHLERIASTRKPATVRSHTMVLKSLLSLGFKLGEIPANIGALLKPPPLDSSPLQRALSAEEVYALLRAPRRQSHRVLLRTLFATGARVSEVLALRWDDMTEGPEHGAAILSLRPKGGGRHAVWIPPSVAGELRAIRRDAAGDAFVFPSSHRPGEAIRRDTVGWIVTAAARRARIAKPVSPHWLRHSHATIAVDNNAPLHLVQATLGHASLGTTGVYLHGRPNTSSARYLGL